MGEATSLHVFTTATLQKVSQTGILYTTTYTKFLIHYICTYFLFSKARALKQASDPRDSSDKTKDRFFPLSKHVSVSKIF